MKKIIIIILLAIGTISSFAKPQCLAPHQPFHPLRPLHCYPVPHMHEKVNYSFWSAFAGSTVGTIIGNVISKQQTEVVVQQPTIVQTYAVTESTVQTKVVTAPIVVKQKIQVWVEGRYIDVVQPNGTIVRTWQPGHYEYK